MQDVLGTCDLIPIVVAMAFGNNIEKVAQVLFEEETTPDLLTTKNVFPANQTLLWKILNTYYKDQSKICEKTCPKECNELTRSVINIQEFKIPILAWRLVLDIAVGKFYLTLAFTNIEVPTFIFSKHKFLTYAKSCSFIYRIHNLNLPTIGLEILAGVYF